MARRPSAFPTLRRAAAAAFAAGAMGLLELVQGSANAAGWGSRTGDWSDAVTNALGAGAFVAIGAAVHAGPGSMRRGAVLSAAILLLLAVAPVATAWIGIHQVRSRFPVLSSFESGWDLNAWDFQHADGRRTEGVGAPGDWALRLELEPHQWASARLRQFPSDWSRWTTLRIVVSVPGPRAVVCHLKVTDRLHQDDYDDRFNTARRLAPGTHELRIPLETIARAPARRRLDLANVTLFEVFADHLPQSEVIVLHDLRLE
jgi:hypothetical protein